MNSQSENCLKQAESVNKRMELVKKDLRKKWMTEGEELVRWRESLGLSRAFIARKTGVDQGRIKRLEEGEPVRDARLLMQVYKLLLEKVEMIRALESFVESFELR